MVEKDLKLIKLVLLETQWAIHAKTPQDLESVTLKCLQKVATKRYSGCHELGMDLHRFLDDTYMFPKSYNNSFFYMVASPMMHAWKAHKENGEGLFLTGDIVATDWRLACEQWLRRREGGLDTNDA